MSVGAHSTAHGGMLSMLKSCSTAILTCGWRLCGMHWIFILHALNAKPAQQMCRMKVFWHYTPDRSHSMSLWGPVMLVPDILEGYIYSCFFYALVIAAWETGRHETTY